MAEMQFRNPAFNVYGSIDCEIEHPRFGWIPITLTEEEYPEIYPQVLESGPADYVAPPPPEPTGADVNAERARRLNDGVDITLSTGEVIPLQGRSEDMRNLQGLCTAAQLRLSQGDTTHETTFRDRLNNDWVLTPSKIVDLWSQGAGWVSQVYEASWAIKDIDPIPSDYADDARWP